MANTKISALTENTNPTWWEELVYAYNNANGKMSLNTMKTFVQNNLSWYATTSDLTTWLATKQDELVSSTNIKTINGSSVLWSWDLIVTWWAAYSAGTWIDITSWTISNTWVTSVNGQTWAVTISWWWQETYDAIVDSLWYWDYTSVKAALDAWKCRLFVKNWTYNHVDEYWDASSSSLWDVYIVWESVKWVVINFSSQNSSSSNRSFIRLRNNSSNGHAFVMKNMTVNVAPAWWTSWSTWPFNCLFWNTVSTINDDKPKFIVSNCRLVFDTTSWWACLTDWFSIWNNRAAQSFMKETQSSWFFWCDVLVSWVYNFWMSSQPYNYTLKNSLFISWYLKSEAPITWVQWTAFIWCFVDIRNDAWVQSLSMFRTYFTCDNIYKWFASDISDYISIWQIENSHFSANTNITTCSYIQQSSVINSYYAIICDTNSFDIHVDLNGWDWSNSYVSNNDNSSSITLSWTITWCEIECNNITVSWGATVVTWCILWDATSWSHTLEDATVTWCRVIWDWSIVWDDYYSYNWATMTWCKCSWAWQTITLNWEACVFSGNAQFNLEIVLWASAKRCIVSWNYANSFETVAWSQYCVITWNCFALSTHSAWTWHVYANNID